MATRAGHRTHWLEGSVGGGWPSLVPIPSRRTSYLSGSLTWSQSVHLTDQSIERDARWYNTPRKYRAGERLRQRWVRSGSGVGPAGT